MTRKQREWLAIISLIGLALTVRLATVGEPLNSDDLGYFQLAQSFVQHTHLVQQAHIAPSSESSTSHHALRVGLVIPVAFFIRLFGATFSAYYAFPLLMSMAGLVASYLIVRRFLGTRIALLTAAVQAFNPLEITTASILLVDTAVASLSMIFVLLISSKPPPRSSWVHAALHGGVCGLVLVWVYLLRSDAVVCLAPMFVAGLVCRRCRNRTAVALSMLGLALAGEQAFYMAKGAEFCYPQHVVANVLNGYAEFWTVHRSFLDYALGYPVAILRLTGWPCLVLFCTTLLAHAYVVIWGRHLVLRAVAASGLLVFAAYSYMLVGPLSRGFVTLPPEMRFIQTYLFTSVVCIPWALLRLSTWMRSRTRAALPVVSAVRRAVLGSEWRRAAAAICALLFLCPMAQASFTRLPRRLLNANGDYMRVLRGIDRYMSANDIATVSVMGTPSGIRAIALFGSLHRGRHIEWHVAGIDECTEAIKGRSTQLFATDLWREEMNLRYVPSEEMPAKTEQLRRLITAAKDAQEVLVAGPRFILVAP